MSGTRNGQSVRGFIADSSNPFDPVKEGYPSSNPDTGFTAKDEAFAGIIHAQPTDGSPELDLYCIDILTATYGGLGTPWGPGTPPSNT